MSWVAAVLAFGVVFSGCSGGDDSPSKPAAAKNSSSTTAKVNNAALPPNVPRSDQLCALTSTLADKFKGAKKPEAPAELVPYIRDLNGYLQQAAAVAPPVLVPDIQKLAEFYAPLADQIESGNAAALANRPQQLGDLAGASNRLREYFSKICGVDDTVFNL
ncbi:MAG TPA: hypothetical protein VM121_00200 [Acidimicrobiales bacterium]|nr:hypothetical protein [Acidimicrobiales bacterium]